MLQVRNVSKWFGDVNVLNQISFNLNRGQRAGLVGPNGSGKSTLLRIIAGEMQPDQGRVQLAPASLRLGYLPQALELPPDATVADVLTAAQGERVSLETRLEQLAERIAVASNDELRAPMEQATPLRRLGDPLDIAAAAVYLASPAASFLTGKTLEVDGGLIVPNLDLPIPDL